jgi:serine/threonine protein kinase
MGFLFTFFEEQRMSHHVGQDIDRYHIVEHLGKGGMAYVYKALDTRLDRFVAVKVIILTPDEDMTKFFKRFEREAKALAKLSHPHIVKIHDYGEDKGTPFLVMEYLEGGTLKAKMGKPTPFTEAARLLIPIAQALDYAHQQNIIHRDIKPANIMLTKSGLPMLTDFGIAKILEKAETTELTGTGVGIGTPDYMSPEQGQGLNVDSRTDIYSLGVVFYELVTGIKPFHADTPMATIIKHITAELPRPRTYIQDLPDEVENIIFKSMAKKSEFRYQTMAEFAAALEKLVHGNFLSPPLPLPPEAETFVNPILATPAVSAHPVEMPETRTANPLATSTATAQPPPDGKATLVASFPSAAQPGEVQLNYPTVAREPSQPIPGVQAASAATIPMDASPAKTGSFKNFYSHPVTRVVRRTLMIILIFFFSISLLSCLILSIASVFASNAIRDAVAASEFISFSSQQEQFLTESESENIINSAIEPYKMWVYTVGIDFQSPDKMFVIADTSVGTLKFEIDAIQTEGTPRFILRKFNDLPLIIAGGIISNGVNDGFQLALDKYHLKVDSLTIDNSSVVYIVSPINP